MKRNKVIILTSIIVGVLVVTLGLTYASLTFNQIGGNSQLVLGDIYMHYGETNQLVLNDAMPSSTYDETKYFEFTIDGRNTYLNKDIWYEIVLNHGENHATRTERIKDKLLKFTLVEIINGEETVVANAKSYEEINNTRLWVNTINKNTTEEVNRTYRLYMWISDSTLIGNIPNADYDIDTWNNQVYASIKVSVTGDFNEKELPLTSSETILKAIDEKAISNPTCKTYVEEDGIIYISGTKDCIDFNYVWYSGKLWRITAIYPGGTMKMITDSAITTIAYGADTNFYTDENNTSYMYQWLNEDFLDTLYNYQNIIVTDYKWNATSGNGDITYKLPTTVEEGATLVSAPVGLLNSYEYYKSSQNTIYSSGYLNFGSGYLNIGYYWWLLNRCSTSSSYVWFVNGSGNGSRDGPSNTYGGRPSVNLKSTTEFNGGSGTKIDPYKIKGDKEEAVANTTLLNTRQSGEYVKFAGEDYRIVGTEVIVDSDTNEEKTITKLNKLDYLRDESDIVITKQFASSATFGRSKNTQNDDYFDYYLNNTWKIAMDDTFEEMLVGGTYYLGSVTASNINYKASICQAASNTVTTKECEKTTSTWTGFVGLPRYGEMFASQQRSENSSSSRMWLITSLSYSRMWEIGDSGTGSFNGSYSNTLAARPSINLTSEIVITGGKGTPNSPYEIALPTE